MTNPYKDSHQCVECGDNLKQKNKYRIIPSIAFGKTNQMKDDESNLVSYCDECGPSAEKDALDIIKSMPKSISNALYKLV